MWGTDGEDCTNLIRAEKIILLENTHADKIATDTISAFIGWERAYGICNSHASKQILGVSQQHLKQQQNNNREEANSLNGDINAANIVPFPQEQQRQHNQD